MNCKRVDTGLMTVKLDLRRYERSKSFRVLGIFPEAYCAI